MQPLSQGNNPPDGAQPRKQRGWLKWLIAALAILVLAVAAGGLYLRRNFSSDKIKAEISALALRHSGFIVSIAEVDFTWTGDVRLKRICLRNPKMLSERCFVSANVISLDLAFLPLIKKQIEVRGAHVDAVEVNFFTEKLPPIGKNLPVELGSWQVAEAAKEPADKSSEQGEARFKLKSLRVTNGTIAHEAKVLPLPAGKTTFAAALTYAPLQQRLTAKLAFPDESEAEAELNIQSANLVHFARQLAQSRRIDAAERVDGAIICKMCNLSALDARLKALNGRLTLQSAGSNLKLASEKAEIGVAAPLKLSLLWAGEAGIDLVTLAFTSGQGKLTGPGLVVQYSDLGADDKLSLKLAFAVQADLPALTPQLTSAALVSGALYASGKYEKGSAVANIKLTQLKVARGNLPVLSAESVNASLAGTQLSLRQQKLALGGQVFTTSLNILLQGRAPNVSGSIDFAELKPGPLLSAGGDAGGIAFAPLSAQLQISGSALRFDKIAAGFARGQISGSYAYDSVGEKHNARLGLSRIRAHDLSEVLKLKATVFGVLDGRFDASFSGNSREQILKTITGTAQASLGRGKIKDSFLQKGILNGPLHKLEAKFSDTEFESAALEASFNSGAISLKKLNFDAGEFNVSMRAEAAAGGQGKATLNFRFRSSFVENVANPLHMGIESLREGDFYDLPFACRGDVFSSACYTKNW